MSNPEHQQSPTSGPPTGYTRATLVIRQDHLEKLKAFAYWERTTVKDVLEELIESFITSQDIKPIPKEKKKFFTTKDL